jgi:hypothetical protein
MGVVDLSKVKEARRLSELVDRFFGDKIKEARRHGCKLMVKLEEEEQMGRGFIYVARIRLVPESNHAQVRMSRAAAGLGIQSRVIEGRADYTEPQEAHDAIGAAIEVVLQLARDAGVF